MTPTFITLILSIATAIIFIAVGIAVGLSWSQVRFRRLRGAFDHVQQTEGIATEIYDLAAALTENLNRRNAQLQFDGERLRQLADEPLGESTSAAVLRLVAQMVEANERLESELNRAEAELDRQSQLLRSHRDDARTDALTGLANRRAFDDELSKVLAGRDDASQPLGLALIDVDHFKSINDNHGHDAGDEVLRRIGSCLAGAVRSSDLIARYGGEEFALIMPGVRREEAITVAEQYRALISNLVIELDNTTLHVTSSQGVTLVRAGDQPRSLTKRADAALYSAKRAGRNRTHFDDGRHWSPSAAEIESGEHLTTDSAQLSAEMKVATGDLRQRLGDLAR